MSKHKTWKLKDGKLRAFRSNAWAVKEDKADGWIDNLDSENQSYMITFLEEFYNGKLDGVNPKNKEFRDESIHQTIGQIKSCFKNNTRAQSDSMNFTDDITIIQDEDSIEPLDKVLIKENHEYQALSSSNPEDLAIQNEMILQFAKNFYEKKEKITRDRSNITLKKLNSEFKRILKSIKSYYKISYNLISENPHLKLKEVPFPKFISDDILRASELRDKYVVNMKKEDLKSNLLKETSVIFEQILGYIDNLKELEELAS